MSSIIWFPSERARTLHLDIAGLASALGLTLDPLQLRILAASHPRVILNCCRQFGKTTLTSVKAVHHALNHPRATIVIAAPSETQSAELVDKCAAHLRTLDIAFKNDRRVRAGLRISHNGARILGLPGTDTTTRGYSASFLIIDEAARVPDSVYTAVRPTLAASSHGPLWLLSTPAAATGFFHRFWTSSSPGPSNAGFSLPPGSPGSPGSPDFSLGPGGTDFSLLPTDFLKFHATVHDCPRISTDQIESMRREFSPDQFARECLAEFSSTRAAVFSPIEIRHAVNPAATRFDFTSHLRSVTGASDHHPRIRYFLGVDFGKSHDHSALALLEFRTTPTGHRDRVNFAPLALADIQLRHLDQIPLGTDYSSVVAHIADLVSHPALNGHTAIVFDANGVGAGIYELLRAARLPAQLVPVTYTSGLKINQTSSIYHVPKSTLIANLQTSFRERYLTIPPSLPHLDSLTRELSLFERTLTASGHAIFQPSQSAEHDDLLNALALANWYVHYQFGERLRRSADGQLFLSVPIPGPLW